MSENQKINLNTATIDDLTTIPGIGEKMAERILAYRAKVGTIATIEELTNVPGISRKMFEKMAASVTTGTEETPVIEAVMEDVIEAEAEAEPVSELQEPEMPSVSDMENAVEDEYIILEDDDTSEAVAKLIPPKPSDAGTEKGPSAQPTPPKSAGVAVKATEPAGTKTPWLVLVAGILGGAALALLVMLLVNGTLQVSSNAKVLEMNNQLSALEAKNKSLQNQISALQESLNAYADLNANLENSQAEILLLKQSRDALTEQTTALSDRTTTLESRTAAAETRISNLETTTDAIDAHVADIDSAVAVLQTESGRFGSFLTGLGELLTGILPPTPEAATTQPTVEATPNTEPTAVATEIATTEPTAEASATPAPEETAVAPTATPPATPKK